MHLSRDDDLVDPIWSMLNKNNLWPQAPCPIQTPKVVKKMMKLALRVFCFAEISGTTRWQMMIPNYYN